MQISEGLAEFLIQNSVYPYYSKRGNIFFRRIKKSNESVDIFDRMINKDAIEKLGLKTEEDCRFFREKIKDEVNKREEHKAIKYWSEDERPREMLIKHGAENLSPAKLLAIVLRTGDSADGVSAEELAKKLLNRFGSFRGIGMVKAVQIKAALEMGKRFMREEMEKKKRIRTAEDVFNFYAPYLRNLKEVVKESAAAVIFVHNHPSGEPKPSEEDIEITNRLVQACNLLGIKILDHIIIGGNSYTNFVNEWLIEEYNRNFLSIKEGI